LHDCDCGTTTPGTTTPDTTPPDTSTPDIIIPDDGNDWSNLMYWFERLFNRLDNDGYQNYTEASVDIAEDALENAITLLGMAIFGLEVTQEQIDEAARQLEAAYNGLAAFGPCGYYPCTCDDSSFWDFFTGTWLGLPVWAWFAIALGVVAIVVILIIVLTQLAKKRGFGGNDALSQEKFRYNDARQKAREAVNVAFTELNEAGTCVTEAIKKPSDKKCQEVAMNQLGKTDKAMQKAEHLVDEFLKQKKVVKSLENGGV